MTTRGAIKKALGLVLSQSSIEWIGARTWDMEMLAACWRDPLYRRSRNQLKELKDKHKGQRCFIIGNGSSLRQMDLTLLKNEFTFGLNRIYLLFDSMGFATTYYVAVNGYVIEQCAGDIDKLKCTKFIRRDYARYLGSHEDTILIRSRSGPRFCRDVAAQGVWEGSTVTYVAMQIAYHMGFSEVILIGVDHHFTAVGSPHAVEVSPGPDANHFDPNYFGKGFKWQYPDLKTSEEAYELARQAYEGAGRRVVDATAGGRLTVFPKAAFEDVINGKARPAGSRRTV